MFPTRTRPPHHRKGSLPHGEERRTPELVSRKKHGCCFKHHHEQDPKLSGRSQNLFTRAHVEFFKDYDCHSGTKEFDFHKEVNFAFTPPEFKPTIEDIVAINENSAKELALGQIITTNAKEHQTWGLDLGVHAVLPDEVAADYLAEEQHATLIMEMEKGEQKAREEEKQNLAFCLGSALPFLMKYTPKKLHTENMILLKGVPGAGKTGRIKIRHSFSARNGDRPLSHQ